MKVLFILFFLKFIYLKKVRRIPKKWYILDFNFEGKDFLSMIESQFKRFNEYFIKFEKDHLRCIDENIIQPELAERVCFGHDFDIFNKAFDVELYKINSIFEHMVDIAFNENCMN